MQGLIIWKNQQVEKLRKDVDRMFDRLWGDFGLAAFPGTVREFPTSKCGTPPACHFYKK